MDKGVSELQDDFTEARNTSNLGPQLAEFAKTKHIAEHFQPPETYLVAEELGVSENSGHAAENSQTHKRRACPPECDEDDQERAKLWCCCLGLPALIIVLLVQTNLADSRKIPEPPPANVIICPTVFDSNNQSVVFSACNGEGCGGSIQWCGLNDASSYRLVVSARGDYERVSETITLNVSGTEVVGSPSVRCAAFFEQLLDQTVTTTGGVLLLLYQNSVDVNQRCYGEALATLLNATLIEVS